MVKDKGIGVAYIPLSWMLGQVGWHAGPPRGGQASERSPELTIWIGFGPKERKAGKKGRHAAALLRHGALALEQCTEIGDGPQLLQMPSVPDADADQPQYAGGGCTERCCVCCCVYF